MLDNARAWSFPYPSRRMPVLAGNVVATSQPLAATAGLEAMRRGGNAVDAALAAAITLTVVEPTGNGIGSDAFAIVWDGKALHGLNASGRSPAAWTPRLFAGRPAMPRSGWASVTVPGAVSAWQALSRRFGRLPFGDLFEPAIRYARNGFPVSPHIAALWRGEAARLGGFGPFADTFLPGGRAPSAGQWFSCPDQAATLEEIARSEGESFYRGPLAERIVACAEQDGAKLTTQDLAEHEAEWTSPLSQEIGGFSLHELPPNTQGIAALIAAGLLGRCGADRFAPDSAANVHLQIEAVKLALADALSSIADPKAMAHAPEDLLDPARLDRLAEGIDAARAAKRQIRTGPGGGTVYLTTADAAGMMVSFIQSNFEKFGSGVVVPGTGIALQNRAAGFSLERGHPNEVGGSKRPFHTLVPGFVTRNGEPHMSFGVMGGYMQAQGHVQMLLRICVQGQNPQAAADAPRWQLLPEGTVALEAGFDAGLAEKLARLGHEVSLGESPSLFGGAQILQRLERGYLAASDPRKDGQAVGF